LIAEESIFRLIKSLNKNEKGFFVKYSKRHKSQNNLSLDMFYYYDRGRKIRYHKKITQNHFSAAKKYLYDNILNSLNQYYANNLPTKLIANKLCSINFLFNKALYAESYKELKKLKSFCLKEEYFEFIFDIIKIERYLILKLNFEIKNTLPALYEQEQFVIKKLQNISEFRKLYVEISILLREKGLVRNEKERKKFFKIISNPLLNNIKHALTIESKILFYSIQTIYYLAIADDYKTNQSALKMIDFFKSSSININRYIKDYIFAYITLIISYYDLGDYQNTMTAIKEIRELKTGLVDEKRGILINTYNIELSIYIVTGRFDEGCSKINSIVSSLNKHRSDKPTVAEIILYFYSSYILFGAGRFEESLGWINKILNRDLLIRSDIYSMARILNLIIHYELNNRELLVYIIKSTYRYLYKRNKIHKTEAAILGFLKKLTKVFDEENLIENFAILHRKLTSLKNDPYEKIALGYFDIISWLESKIYKRNFSDIIRETYSAK